jgi:hypothetical protein
LYPRSLRTYAYATITPKSLLVIIVIWMDSMTAEKRDRTKANEAQAAAVLEALKRSYNDELINDVLSMLPAPPPGEAETNKEELIGILNSYLKAFKEEVFWEAVRKIGLRPSKPSAYESTYGGLWQLAGNEELIAIEVKGQNTMTRTGRGEFQIEMIGDGFVIPHARGGKVFDRFPVGPGDVVKSDNNLITIINLSPSERAQPPPAGPVSPVEPIPL